MGWLSRLLQAWQSFFCWTMEAKTTATNGPSASPHQASRYILGLSASNCKSVLRSQTCHPVLSADKSSQRAIATTCRMLTKPVKLAALGALQQAADA